MASASSSRGKQWYEAFNPLIIADAYSGDNLEAFIAAAGKEEYDRFKDAFDVMSVNILARSRAAEGVDEADHKAVAAANQRAARTGTYRKARQDFRYQWVMRLHNEGRLSGITLKGKSDSEQARSGRKVELNIEHVQGEWKATGMGATPENRTEFARRLASNPPFMYKTNALEEAAKLLNVRGRSTIKASGDTKRYALYNLIMQSMGLPSIAVPEGVAVVEARTRPMVTVSVETQEKMRAILASRGISNSGQLSAMNKIDLTNLARAGGLTTTGRKEDLANRIAAAVRFEALPSTAEMTKRVEELTIMGTTRPADAIAQARQLNADALRLVPRETLHKFARAVRLEGLPTTGTPSREAIITALTGQQTAGSLRLSRREEIVRGEAGACEAASLQEVQSIARDLGIQTIGLSKSYLCTQIRAHEDMRVARSLLINLDELEKISGAAAGDQRNQAWSNFLRRHRLPANLSLENASNSLLSMYYLGRASTLNPIYGRRLVEDYLRQGTIPTDALQRESLAMIFSDANPRLQDVTEPEAIARELERLRGTLIIPVSRGGAGRFQTLRTYAPRFLGTEEFGTRVRTPSPIQSMAPVASTSTAPLEGGAWDFTATYQPGASNIPNGRGATTALYSQQYGPTLSPRSRSSRTSPTIVAQHAEQAAIAEELGRRVADLSPRASVRSPRRMSPQAFPLPASIPSEEEEEELVSI